MMKWANRFAPTLWLTLIASTSMSAPSSAQKIDVAARSARITELGSSGRYSEAIPLVELLLADIEKVYGAEHREVAATLNSLAGRSFFYAAPGPCWLRIGRSIGGLLRGSPPRPRSPQGGAETWPRRGSSPGNAWLPERHHVAQERLSRALGAVRADRRGGGTLIAPFVRCNKGVSSAAHRRVNEPAALSRDAARFEPYQCSRLNKPNNTGSAWQIRRSQLLGRRTVAGRLY
jgi:hypothetical protein